MIHQRLEQGGHKWQKTNLVTQPGRGGGYDSYVCEHCGCVGKSYNLGYIDIPQRHAYKASKCPKAPKAARVKITRCGGYGPQFKNLVPDSIHEVLDRPELGSTERGVWVMGVGEPVLLLWGEFTEV